MAGQSEGRKGSDGPRTGEPGFNPLFVGVLLAVVLGVIAGLFAGDSTLLRSNLVFRFVVGGVVAAIAYAIIAALWLAWHRQLVKKLGIAGQNFEPGNPAKEAEVRNRDLEVAEFMGASTEATEELKRRVEALEDESERG